jgi:glutaconate CoA-transferase subunit A
MYSRRMSRRRSVLTTAEEVVSLIAPGATVGFGGIINSCHAMPIVREIIRRGIGDLHVVGVASGLEVDMLIAAGLVRRVSTAAVSAETVGMIAPAFRRAAQAGEIEVLESDEGMMYVALQAAAQRLDFAPYPVGMGAVYAEVNDGMTVMESPFSGRPVMAIQAIPLDFAFIHAAASDPFGNVQPAGGGLGDRALARAAAHVVCTVERLVGNHDVRRNPQATAIPGADGIVYAPFGSHPFASPGFYIHDEPFMREYLAAADAWLRRDDRRLLDEFFADWVTAAPTHWEYIERVGTRRLHALTEALHHDLEPEAPQRAGLATR